MTTPPLWLLPVKWALNQVPDIEQPMDPMTPQEHLSDWSRLLFYVGIKGIKIGSYRVGNKWAIRTPPDQRSRGDQDQRSRGDQIPASIEAVIMIDTFLRQPSRSTGLIKNDEGIIEVV